MSKVISQIQLDFKDVLIKPKKSYLNSRSEVHLSENYKFLHSKQTYKGIPVVIANMDTTGTMSAAKIASKHHIMTALHKHYTVGQLVDFFGPIKTEDGLIKLQKNQHWLTHTFYSIGMASADIAKFEEVLSIVGLFDEKKPEKGGVRMICVDVANGYMNSFVKYCKDLRQKYPNLIIMAGNVVDSAQTSELLINGVDIVKVGIGPGSVCQTRVVAGVGRPQFSAILDCQEAADHLGGYIVSDGGITCIADFSKALGAGSWGVMAGGFFSGHTESEQEIIKKDDKEFIKFYGMSSKEAMEKHSGGVADYRASEGKLVLIPHKGSIDKTVGEMLGGIRSSHTYVGAKNLSEFRKVTEFYRVSQEVNEIFGKSK